MIEKDKEILKLKAELARQQNSIQQTSAKQQKEFQEQIEQMIVQRQVKEVH